MTILDIAQSIKGRLRDGLSQTQSGTQPGESEVAFGTAAADSSGGFVSIIMDGAPTDDPDYDPADYTFEVPCDSPITAGDRVSYISDAGRGKAVSLGTLTQIAEDADAIATATDQHFWADTNGVHVSTDEDDPAGAQNIIMNSAGVLLREGSDYLAAFTPSAVSFYDGNGNTSDNITASFGASGATIGKPNEAHSIQTSSDTTYYAPDGSTELAGFGLTLDDGKPSLWLDSKRQRVVASSSTSGNTTYREIALECMPVSIYDENEIVFRAVGGNQDKGLLVVTSRANISVNPGVTVGPDTVYINGLALNLMSPLAIASGGTGATTAQGARKNLHIGAATATKTSATSTATTNTKITLNSITSSDSSLFSISSGGIKCAVAGTVLVSASMYETSIASGNGGFALRILNGSTLIGSEMVAPFTTSSLMATVTAAPRAVTVAAGDVIYLYHRSTKSGSIPANGAYLTVEYIA